MGITFCPSCESFNFFHITACVHVDTAIRIVFVFQVEIGQRLELSVGDAKQMNLMYNCPDKGWLSSLSLRAQ